MTTKKSLQTLLMKKLQKIILGFVTALFLSGCSVSLPGNPDSKNFDEQYEAVPDFAQEEQAVLDGEL